MMRGWILIALASFLAAAGCTHTGKSTYAHSGSEYTVSDYLHTGYDDYYDRSWAADHRSHWHR